VPALAATGLRNLRLEWIDQQQAMAGGEAMSVDEMVAVGRAEPEGVSTIVMALAGLEHTLRAVLHGLMKP
jgi:hypothetical protein